MKAKRWQKMSDTKFLMGRTAIVTGGATGIGRATALALATAGANVVIGSRTASSRPPGGEIAQQSSRILMCDADVTSAESVEQLYTTILEEFGQVDILVNSAGIMPDHPLSDHPDELWDETIAVNLTGVYRTVKTCLPGMIKQKWGRIINIATTAASVSAPGFGAYSASKAGVVGLTRCIALEGADHGVTCNAISPGWVETDMAIAAIRRYAEAEGRDFAQYLEEIKQSNPQKRMVQPAEIASLVLYLCREDASGMTMQDLVFSAGSLW